MSSSAQSTATISAAPASAADGSARAGALAAGICFFCWGLVPLYWKQLAAIDALELIAHRNVWSLGLVFLVLAAQGGFGAFWASLREPGALGANLLSGSLLTTNWLVYVWGVNHDRVTECSLGYFLVPLVNVAVGRFVLHERLRRLQWLAIALAALGVALMIFQLGRLPWIALTLAGSWGAYSLMRKQSAFGPLHGLAAETLLLAPLAIGYLAWLGVNGTGALGHVDTRTHLLILASGLITAVPLILFAYGARRIRLTTMGLLQYSTPTAQLALAVWLYHEPFPHSRLISFAFIWIGLALYTADNLLAGRKSALRAA